MPPVEPNRNATVDAVAQSWYSMCFDREFSRRRGTEFQALFSDIMDRAYPGSFDRVKPYGAEGDHKCDGYLRTTGTVFQVYAPDRLVLAPLLKKIRDDFNGALAHWGERMRVWALVSNERDGLPARAVQLLGELATAHMPVQTESWGRVRLHDTVLALHPDALAALFGPAPTRRDAESVGYDRLQPVLLALAKHPAPPQLVIRPVPSEKIAINDLSAHVADLLRLGRLCESVVKELLQRSFDPTLGDQLAAAFHDKYEQLRSLGLRADEVFWNLQAFAGGGARRAPAEEAAVLTVLSYFFERCDIFEDGARGATT